MGLERVVSCLNGVRSNYDTTFFSQYLRLSRKLAVHRSKCVRNIKAGYSHMYYSKYVRIIFCTKYTTANATT